MSGELLLAGDLWNYMTGLPRQNASALRTNRAAVPRQQGVYAWFHDNEPIYSASGQGGLRARLRRHLDTGPDLSWSSYDATSPNTSFSFRLP
jgi:hypothetical protein